MLLAERIEGCVLGAILGDCVGSPYQHLKAEALKEMSFHKSWRVGNMGLGSELMLASLARIAKNGFSFDEIARSYADWVATQPFELDIINAKIFGSVGTPKANILWSQVASHSHGGQCSGVLLLRQIPLVLAGLAWDPSTLQAQVALECRLTHDEPICIEAAQIYALCLQSIFNGRGRFEIWQQLQDSVRSPILQRLLVDAYYRVPQTDDSNASHCLVTLQFALHHFFRNTPFVSAVRGAVLSGGATDTNASATAALLGARSGKERLPESWLEAIIGDNAAVGAKVRRSLKQAIYLSQRPKTQKAKRKCLSLLNKKELKNDHQDLDFLKMA